MIPLKTPYVNELVEMMNRTLMERVRFLLSHAKLSKVFSGELVLIVALMLNCSPYISL